MLKIADSWLYEIIGVLFIIGFIGCAGSKSQSVNMRISPSLSGPISLMPYNTNFERYYYSDAHQRGVSILEKYIIYEIQKRSNAFTYTFDSNDLKNLRTTILESLNSTGQFTSVKDVNFLGDDLPSKGIKLFIDFKRMGISQKIAFVCTIEAKVKVESYDGKILGEKEIVINEKGLMSVSAAKNNAIRQFINELEELLNTI
ncbi:MAG: hypothetical protein KKD92_14270 [Proteobacteria bacterium]|nr:hypothetical protein [Pseudomonadota bacterium]